MSSIDPDLVRLLKRLKLGPLLPTLPERLTLARAQQLDYVAFLTLLLADEVQRRDQQALERHLLQAGFEDRVTLDGFDWTSPVQLDRRQLQQVFTLEFLARKEHVVFVGPVGIATHYNSLSIRKSNFVPLEFDSQPSTLAGPDLHGAQLTRMDPMQDGLFGAPQCLGGSS